MYPLLHSCLPKPRRGWAPHVSVRRSAHVLSSSHALIGHSKIPLRRLVHALYETLPAQLVSVPRPPLPQPFRPASPTPPPAPNPGKQLTGSFFFRHIEAAIPPGSIVVCDVGDSSFRFLEHAIPPGCIFVSNAVWFAIGYSIPAVCIGYGLSVLTCHLAHRDSARLSRPARYRVASSFLRVTGHAK